MRYVFDKLYFDGERMQVEGWACPETNGDTIEVKLTDMEGNPVDCPIEIYFRQDIQDTFFNGVGDASYGFRFTYQAEKYRDLYLKFSTLEHDFDFTGKTIEFKEIFNQYHKERSFFGKLKRSLSGSGRKDTGKK